MFRKIGPRFAANGCDVEAAYKEIHQHHKVCEKNPDQVPIR
jgi:hypothetical protein